jgi:hypothetical protein
MRFVQVRGGRDVDIWMLRHGGKHARAGATQPYHADAEYD